MENSGLTGDHNILIIYPLYFDINRTISDGRRLPKTLCCKYSI